MCKKINRSNLNADLNEISYPAKTNNVEFMGFFKFVATTDFDETKANFTCSARREIDSRATFHKMYILMKVPSFS